MNTLVSLSEATSLIKSGAVLAIAASAQLLSRLPRGNWIAGTSHYFVGAAGGMKSDEQLFVTDLGKLGTVKIATYTADAVGKITEEAPDNGFSVVIVPASSQSLTSFAHRPYSSELFMKPVVGWVAGVDLADIHNMVPQVVDGRTGRFENNALVVAHVTLPEGKMANLSIVNPFVPARSQRIRFEKEGFSATHCTVNGEKRALVDLLIEAGNQHGRRPLIGDCSGALVNVSIQAVECVSGKVDFYAPVFPDTDYYIAEPLSDYQAVFTQASKEREGAAIIFSCNCILNYLYGSLEGRKLGSIHGPVTFGEIAYQLLNQTMVILEIV